MGHSEWLARAHYHLVGWGEWRRHAGNATSRGYDSSSAVVSSGGNSATFDHLVAVEDSRVAAICEAIIDDLSRLHRTALESEYILQGVMKHNRIPPAQLLLNSQLAFWDRAKKRLV